MQYPELAAEVAKAQGEQSLEGFADDLGCGIRSLARWLAGTHFPRSASHRRALEERGVPAHVLQAPEKPRGTDATDSAAADHDEAA